MSGAGKERPILFSAPMVRAILAGTKVQTRRVLRGFFPPSAPEYDSESGRLEWLNGDEVVVGMNCPYGRPGDRLWVREAWQSHLGPFGESLQYAYRATDDEALGPWRPSIHMPRAASRITLEITGVRVERLQDVWHNDAECIAEGIEEMPAHPSGTRRWRNYLPNHPQAWSPSLANPGNSFATLWRSINGDDSWTANPWVWVVEFKRINEGGQHG